MLCLKAPKSLHGSASVSVYRVGLSDNIKVQLYQHMRAKWLSESTLWSESIQNKVKLLSHEITASMG